MKVESLQFQLFEHSIFPSNSISIVFIYWGYYDHFHKLCLFADLCRNSSILPFGIYWCQEWLKTQLFCLLSRNMNFYWWLQTAWAFQSTNGAKSAMTSLAFKSTIVYTQCTENSIHKVLEFSKSPKINLPRLHRPCWYKVMKNGSPEW